MAEDLVSWLDIFCSVTHPKRSECLASEPDAMLVGDALRAYSAPDPTGAGGPLYGP